MNEPVVETDELDAGDIAVLVICLVEALIGIILGIFTIYRLSKLEPNAINTYNRRNISNKTFLENCMIP